MLAGVAATGLLAAGSRRGSERLRRCLRGRSSRSTGCALCRRRRVRARGDLLRLLVGGILLLLLIRIALLLGVPALLWVATLLRISALLLLRAAVLSLRSVRCLRCATAGVAPIVAILFLAVGSNDDDHNDDDDEQSNAATYERS